MEPERNARGDGGRKAACARALVAFALAAGVVAGIPAVAFGLDVDAGVECAVTLGQPTASEGCTASLTIDSPAAEVGIEASTGAVRSPPPPVTESPPAQDPVVAPAGAPEAAASDPAPAPTPAAVVPAPPGDHTALVQPPAAALAPLTGPPRFGTLAQVGRAVAEAPAFPLLLVVLVGLFLLVQHGIDRGDPKLALAPLEAEDALEFAVAPFHPTRRCEPPAGPGRVSRRGEAA